MVWNLFWGWHEPLYGQISFMIIVVFGRLCISFYLFLWLIFDTYFLCVVCGVFVFLGIPCKPTIYQLFWRLEVNGWLEETVCAYTFVIMYSWYV